MAKEELQDQFRVRVEGLGFRVLQKDFGDGIPVPRDLLWRP